MKTILTSLRVSDLSSSTAFYAAIGYEELGRVEVPNGVTLVMLSLPDDRDEVTLELSCEPNGEPLVVGNGLSHLAVQVDDLAATTAALQQAGIETGVVELPGGPDGPRTCFVLDPDGYRIELVQWPEGHTKAMTRADFQ